MAGYPTEMATLGSAAPSGRGLKSALSALALVAILGTARPSHDYLDPGTGSILLPLLLGGAAGAMVIVMPYWHRFNALIGRGDSQLKSAPEQPAKQHPAE